jgi:hypothetical protein
MVIRFFCIHQSHKKRTAPTRGLSIRHHVQEAIEALQTAFRWIIPFLLHAGHFSFVQMPQNGTVVLTGLTLGITIITNTYFDFKIVKFIKINIYLRCFHQKSWMSFAFHFYFLLCYIWFWSICMSTFYTFHRDRS